MSWHTKNLPPTRELNARELRVGAEDCPLCGGMLYEDDEGRITCADCGREWQWQGLTRANGRRDTAYLIIPPLMG